MKQLLRTIILTVIVLSLSLTLVTSETSALTKRQKRTAKRIAKTVTSNWKKYGRLPSVAIGQAWIESGLGSGGSNLFGVRGQRGRSVESSTIGYLQCLNNKYFRGEGSFNMSRSKQLSIIMKGDRYCAGQYPGGSYYNNVLRSIYRYGWGHYDDILKKKLKQQADKKLRKKRQKGSFRIIFSDELVEGTATVDPKWIKKGSTIVFPGGIVEATSTKRGLKNTIIVGRKRTIFSEEMVRIDFFDNEKLTVHIDVYENAKG